MASSSPARLLAACGAAVLGVACSRPRPSVQPEPTASEVTPAPLGSIGNPVRAGGVFGEREFLRRLVCPGGTAPQFERRGSLRAREPHPSDGHMLDDYAVTCSDTAGGQTVHTVIIDMYHPGYRERGTLPPFTVLPELPARTATGCPPRVSADPDSSARYVFNELEVEQPARPLNMPAEPFVIGIPGRYSVSLVVDTLGRPEAGTIRHAFAARMSDTLRARVDSLVQTLQFSPALHHAGCIVRQGTGIVIVAR
jgi:hypothetical protein